MVHCVSGWTRGMQVKLWDPLRTRAIPERLTGVITTRRYTNPRLPYLTLPVRSLANYANLWVEFHSCLEYGFEKWRAFTDRTARHFTILASLLRTFTVTVHSITLVPFELRPGCTMYLSQRHAGTPAAEPVIRRKWLCVRMRSCSTLRSSIRQSISGDSFALTYANCLPTTQSASYRFTDENSRDLVLHALLGTHTQTRALCTPYTRALWDKGGLVTRPLRARDKRERLFQPHSLPFPVVHSHSQSQCHYIFAASYETLLSDTVKSCNDKFFQSLLQLIVYTCVLPCIIQSIFCLSYHAFFLKHLLL